MNKSLPAAIIGGGIVGCAIAYELSINGYKNVAVIERNKTIPGLNQSSVNESTIHSGIYYPKDIMPLKAKLCVEGNSLLYEFMNKYNLPYNKVGKLIVATNPLQEEYLDFFFQVGIENGVSGIKKITTTQAKRMEPNIENVTAALYVPSCGCGSTAALINKIKDLARLNGVTFIPGTKVVGIVSEKERFIIFTETKSGVRIFKTDLLINSAGLYSDEIAKMINPVFPYKIDPVRGEFCRFDKSIRKKVRMSGMHVYQAPYCYTNENNKLKIVDIPISDLPKSLRKGSVIITSGIHLSPAYTLVNEEYILGNTVTISPLKTTGLGKEDYTNQLYQAADYIQKVHTIFPNLKEKDLKMDHTGIMCPLKGYRDFIIEKDKKFPNCISLVGLESPAWTASLAIAKFVQNLIS